MLGRVACGTDHDLLYLESVAASEFLPARRIVSKPLSQRGTGRNVFEPFIDGRRLLCHAAGQSRSINIRVPSPRVARSYARFNWTLAAVMLVLIYVAPNKMAFSIASLFQCRAFVYRNMVGLGALDFVVGISLASA